VVTRRQLLRAGVGPHWIDARLKAGRLRRAHRGVYLVGPVFPPLAKEMAAVLACGEGAALSHRAAATLWQLLPHPARDRAVDVTVPVRHAKGRRGIRVHRAGPIPPDETTILDGIPITAPARTLLDLAAVVPPGDLERAVAEAERRRLASRSRLAALLARYARRPGTRALRALVEMQERPAFIRSEAERRLLRLVRKARLPAPDVNAPLHGFEVDLLWRDAALVVEVDGYAFHSGRAAFEEDRRRDAELAARGLTVVRVTWRQLADQPEAVVVRIGQALARLGG
jgi:very-short-patch-repair endonuclease